MSTWASRRSAWTISSSTKRVLPIPASPRTAKSPPRPANARQTRHGGGASAPPPLEDLPIQLPGLDLRLDTQLPLHDVHALLILPKRRSSLSELRVERHECPVHWFLEGIEREQSVRGADRQLELARLTLLGQQSGQALECPVAQSRPLAP